jgi:pyruvate kinase
MEKLTKIVATISDRRSDPEFLQALYEAGMDVVRLNTAHQSTEQSLKVIENIRKISDKIGILIDTKGPEIRTTDSEHIYEVTEGENVIIRGNPATPTVKDFISVNYKDFVSVMEPGKRILIDDGEIELLVIDKHDEYLECRAMNSGLIKPRKSVNLPGTVINLPSLNEKDIEFIDLAIKQNIDFIAHSFVRNKEDVIAIQSILDAHNSPVKIIAKIENQEGVDNINEILDHVYGIMVARGDLAIEVPAERIPVIQNMLINKCIRRKKPVIIATQMLHSMIQNPRPTRAEVSDIANAIFSGTDAIMLSGETAYGDYPLESVRIMTRTAREAEKSKPSFLNRKIMPHENQISVFLSKSAVRSVEKLDTRAIITDTDTGKTAKYLSAFRGTVPIYAQCYDKRVVRELALCYGIVADFMHVETSKKDFLRATLNRLLERKEIRPQDLIAVLAGNFGKKAGPSFLEISTVQNLLSDQKFS